jgi:flagellar biosynthesis protein FliQ
MDSDLLHEIMIQSIRLSLLISLPLIGSSMVLGLIISIFQATTSVQEQTLTFVPKIIIIVIALIIFGPWITDVMIEFTEQIFAMIPDVSIPHP